MAVTNLMLGENFYDFHFLISFLAIKTFIFPFTEMMKFYFSYNSKSPNSHGGSSVGNWLNF